MQRLTVIGRIVSTFSVLCGILILLCEPAAAQVTIRSDFDHDSTGFRLDGAHAVAGCGDCHRRGLFVGTSTRCASCHTIGGVVQATAKPATHILSSDNCDACHAVRSFIPLQTMDHSEAVGDCASCHDNRVAVGKPADHPPTSNQCDSCHLTVRFSPVLRFDHTGIDSNCVNCHNGQAATGKPPGHLPTTNVCEDCHRVDSFSLVTAFDHLQAIGQCSGCHDTVRATGKPPGHVPTTAECDACHGTSAW